MNLQPEGYYLPDGELHLCDRCGAWHRHKKELRVQNGLWLCEMCLDEQERKKRGRS